MYSRQMIVRILFLMFFLCFGLHDINANVVQEKQKAKHIKTLILSALPGSGKSEVRKYLSSLSADERRNQFGIASTVQIDDFPYVHMMRRISDELVTRGRDGLFFLSPANSFRDPMDWGTLTHLINMDYKELMAGKKITAKYAADWLFKRIDAARVATGVKPVMKKLPRKVYKQVAKAVEADAAKLLKNKNAEVARAKELDEKTVVIEFSRGGADTAPMPLARPFGYQYAYSQLAPEILETASILNIWVTPEESRRKNEARANPNDPGSILNHCVPRAVMFADYGCDDIEHLLNVSGKKNTVKVEAHGKVYHLPLGRFDNRVDKTTFVRKGDALTWANKDVQALRSGLEKAFASLIS